MLHQVTALYIITSGRNIKPVYDIMPCYSSEVVFISSRYLIGSISIAHHVKVRSTTEDHPKPQCQGKPNWFEVIE